MEGKQNALDDDSWICIEKIKVGNFGDFPNDKFRNQNISNRRQSQETGKLCKGS